MKKERKVIEPNATIVFDRDVRYSELMELIPRGFEGTIIIHGELFADKENYGENNAITCESIYADSIDSLASTDLIIYGNLISYGDIWTDYLYVTKDLICFGNLNTNILDSDGAILVIGKIDASHGIDCESGSGIIAGGINT